MSASATDKFRKVARKWVGQIGSGGVADATVTTIPLSSSTNLPTDTAVMITVDRVDSAGKATASKEEGIVGVVSGNDLVSCTRGVEGTAQAHSAGAVVEVLWTADNINDLIDGFLVEHGQDGTHNSSVVKLAGAQTITGAKTFTTGLLKAVDITSGSGVSTLPTSTDTLVGKATTDILTNKTVVQKVTSYTPDAAGTATLDVRTGGIHHITMPAGNITIAITNEAVGQCFIIEILQDDVGSRTVTWFTTIKWAGGSAPTLTTTASKRDTFGFRVTGTDTYDGFIVGQNI